MTVDILLHQMAGTKEAMIDTRGAKEDDVFGFKDSGILFLFPLFVKKQHSRMQFVVRLCDNSANILR